MVSYGEAAKEYTRYFDNEQELYEATQKAQETRDVKLLASNSLSLHYLHNYKRLPDNQRSLIKGYRFLDRLLSWGSNLMILYSIYLSFTWHWWAFIPAALVYAIICRIMQKIATGAAFNVFHGDPLGAMFLLSNGVIVPVDDESKEWRVKAN